MRRALLPILAAVALAATAVAAPAAKAPARKARAKAVAFVVQVVRPGADPVALGSLRTRAGSATGGGDFAFPATAAPVRVTGSTTAVEAVRVGHRGVGPYDRHRRRRVAARRPGQAASLRVAAGADAKNGNAKSSDPRAASPASASAASPSTRRRTTSSTCRASAR